MSTSEMAVMAEVKKLQTLVITALDSINMNPSKEFSLHEAANILGVGHTKLKSYIEKGDRGIKLAAIPARFGKIKTYRILASDLAQFQRERRSLNIKQRREENKAKYSDEGSGWLKEMFEKNIKKIAGA